MKKGHGSPLHIVTSPPSESGRPAAGGRSASSALAGSVSRRDISRSTPHSPGVGARGQGEGGNLRSGNVTGVLVPSIITGAAAAVLFYGYMNDGRGILELINS